MNKENILGKSVRDCLESGELVPGNIVEIDSALGKVFEVHENLDVNSDLVVNDMFVIIMKKSFEAGEGEADPVFMHFLGRKVGNCWPTFGDWMDSELERAFDMDVKGV